jgi:tripartite-type tricarboxylate transporter receptor subunit TctC
MVAQRLSVTLGQTIIDNRPGAGGLIGAKAVASAEPDGYTLLFGTTGSLAIGPALQPNIDYDPVKAFTTVALVSEVPYVVVVHPSVPANTIQELVAYAKANPGKLNSGATSGTPTHLACEILKVATGTNIVHIAYKGGAQALTDLLGGQLHVICDQTTVLLEHIQGNKVRAIASMGTQRLPQLPNVPTMGEGGYPDVVVTGWFGILAPAGTPPNIVAKLNTEINEALKSPELKSAFAKFQAEPLIGSPQNFHKFLLEEIPRWAAIVKQTGAKAE